MDIDVDERYLDTAKAAASPELKHAFDEFKQLYDQKLWHQLTIGLERFYGNPASAPFQIDLFRNFIWSFANKINQNRLVGLGVQAARQFEDGAEALPFLTALTEKVNEPKSQDAYVHAVMEAAHFKLLLGDLEGTKSAMDQCEKILDAFDSVESGVHAAFYRVGGDYYKARAEYANYYKSSLLYLACVNLDSDLTPSDRVQRAHDLGISALLGDTIYNFGELLMHPVLESLTGTEHEWIKNLLSAFNAGDIGRFESLVPYFPKEPILQENYPFLRQKICLMALIESVFRRSADDRTLAFATIAAETRLPLDEVEHLVMKALSLGLIRGTLDQVAQTANITWVQPRVLDSRQLEDVATRLDTWCGRVAKVGDFVKSQTLTASDLFSVVEA